MIVWLNGAFGVGKTTTARELSPLLPKARVHDPEVLGWVLQHTVGRLQRGDFQHLASWRRGTALLTRWASRNDATVIVPMSVLRPDYLDGILGDLRAHGHTVHHFLLDATTPALHTRITDGDANDPRATHWRREHVANYQDVRAEIAARGATIDTGDTPPAHVAGSIAYALGFVDAPGIGKP